MMMQGCLWRHVAYLGCKGRLVGKHLSLCNGENTIQIIPGLFQTNAFCSKGPVSHFQSQYFSKTEEKKGSYFNEFYEVVKEDVNENKNAKVLTKWQKLSDDKEVQKRAMNRWIFQEVVNIYIDKNPRQRRRHVDFILEALERMNELGVQRDLTCYKSLLTVFPPDIMVPENRLQIDFKHFPRQQDCAIELMEQMEENAVVPDREFGHLVGSIFGMQTHAGRKLRRMLYWMPKFKNANPYKLPHYLPDDAIQLALLALKKMVVDIENEFKVWKVEDEENPANKTFIASAQSPYQRTLLSKHPLDVPLYVEGGFKVWLRNIPQTYFVLRSDSDPKLFQYPSKEEEEEKLFDFETIFESEAPKELAPRPSDHEQEDGTILGMCITGTSTKDSLIMWIRNLQETNPNLEKTPIVFTLRTLGDSLLTLEESEKNKTTEVLNPS